MKRSKEKQSTLLVSGGTGGHVFPALTLANELLKTGNSVILMTDVRGAKMVAKHGHIFLETPTHQTPNKAQESEAFPKLFSLKVMTHPAWLEKLTHKILGMHHLVLGVFKTFFFIRKKNIAVTIGFGGGVCFWPLLYSRLLRAHCCIYEPDSVLGRTNKILGFFCAQIWLGFKNTQGLSASFKKKVTSVGLIAQNFSAPLAPSPQNGRTDFRLLVLGGSQGAAFFSTVVPQAAALLNPDLKKRLHITQQCREELLDETKKKYDALGIRVTLKSFIDHVQTEMHRSHFIICRSGSGTLSDLTSVRRTALLIPYPYATQNHQMVNAKNMADSGCIHQRQENCTPDFLAQILSRALLKPGRYPEKLCETEPCATETALSRMTQKILNILKKESTS